MYEMGVCVVCISCEVCVHMFLCEMHMPHESCVSGVCEGYVV